MHIWFTIYFFGCTIGLLLTKPKIGLYFLPCRFTLPLFTKIPGSYVRMGEPEVTMSSLNVRKNEKDGPAISKFFVQLQSVVKVNHLSSGLLFTKNEKDGPGLFN
ncbi:hypothetical protein VNO77_03932 [Canavalia gladiata]|uniref:Uncharacterized protein n=1 Tax=Canavalia gladiata TaxID=3824 RepID=A0AAN9R7A4_CANGL